MDITSLWKMSSLTGERHLALRMTLGAHWRKLQAIVLRSKTTPMDK